MARPVALGTDDKLFRALHRRHVDGGRPPPPWGALRVDALDDATRERLRAAWSARVAAEYRSMVVFSELLARMPEAGLPLEVSCAASRLVADEARHTEYCARLADALGGRADATVTDDDLRLADGALSARLFVARWTASMFCVGESASVGLLQALAREATDPCVRAVLDALLRDESLHDRFGWALARAVFPALTDDEREWLGADLAFAFAHYDRQNGRSLRPDGAALPDEPAGCDAYAGASHGVVAPARYARAWYERLDGVILPGLAALGVPAYEAWALRHEAR